MPEATQYTPSTTFKAAARFLSNTSGLAKTPNEKKLELYGLYKFLTVSADPTISRPSIFSPTERTKYDAWKSTGATWLGKESAAEARYIDIARSLGWTPGAEEGPTTLATETTAEELLAEDSANDSQIGSGGGMGFGVSIVQRDEVDEEQSLHSMAIKGDVQQLEAYLETHAGLNVNDIDEYGFTALHLASDRGNVATVRRLLQKGADAELKDSDGLSALDLALEAGHDDVAALLRNSSQAA